MRINKILPFILLVIVVGVITYFNRWIFTFKFEPEYWENYYYESQWNVANSKRMISDEGVYRYIGYRLVNGENPFNVDYWVPPMGKYWYGWGAKYLGNPYLISYFCYLAAIGIFWLLANRIFVNRKLSFITTLLFAVNPLLVEQIGQTMLDLPLTLFFMLTILGLLWAAEKKNNILVIGAGVALGLMAGVKPPYFVPMIALVGTVWLYGKKVKGWWYFWPSIVAGYLLAYTCYFVKHPNPIPFIRLHQKVLEFQKNNGGSHDVLNFFKMVFLDRYKGHWVEAKIINPVNWSIVLPVGTIGLGWICLKFIKIIKENDKIILVTILGVGYILMNLTIDFWPRYLMPLIPILILVSGYLFKKRPATLILIFMTTLPSLYILMSPSPTPLLEDFGNKTKEGFYRETYRMLSNESRAKYDETTWKQTGATLTDSQVEAVKEDNQWRVRIKYF